MNGTAARTRYSAWLLAACAVVVASCLGALLRAQVFRTGVDLVVLDVIVTDASGRPVEDLAAQDFEVLEDGQRRPVVSTSVVSLPEHPSPTAGADVPDDVWANRLSDQQRIFTIVIDDLNTLPGNTSRARDVVRRFIERLPAGDLAAIVYTGQQIGAQEFTADKPRLLASLRQLTGRNPVPTQDLIDGAWTGSEMNGNLRESLQGERAANFQRMGLTLQNVVEWLAPIAGRRKAVLLMTEGLPPAVREAFATGHGSLGATFRRVTATAMRANVAIYPLDLRGLAVPLGPGQAREEDGGFNALSVLANETGGVATFNTNDLAGAFDRLVQDSSHYYLVGYESATSPEASKPGVRRIAVRARRPGLTVRARRGYATGIDPGRKKGASDALTRVLDSPLPGGAVSLEVQATPFPRANNGARVMVVLEVDGGPLPFRPAGSRQEASLTYRVAAANVYGEAKAQDGRQVRLTLSDARRDQIQHARLRLVSHLDLEPGTYRLRAAVIEGERHGVVVGDLDVPDYRKLPVTLSGPMMASAASAKAPVPREDFAAFDGRLPAVPTTRRRFSRSDSVEMYAEIHLREPSAPAPDVAASLLSERGDIVASVAVTVGRPGKGLGGALTYPARASLRMTDLPVGPHVLEISASTARGERAVRRVAFAVVN